jgi:formyl-CoA transferase/succinyl-CoA--D-citramalate CoA-transferase
LNERHRSGRGQEVDVAIYEAVAALMESSMVDFEVAGHLRTRTGSVLPGVAPSNVYPTADGSSIIIAANADAVFRRLCVAMGAPELADDERFATHRARGVNMEQLDEMIGQWTTTLPGRTALERLADAGVPAGEIFTAENMLSDEHYAARDMVLRRTNRDGLDVPMTGIVPKFSRTPGDVAAAGPALGEHTEEVVRGIAGIDRTTFDGLLAAGILATSQPPTQ